VRRRLGQDKRLFRLKAPRSTGHDPRRALRTVQQIALNGSLRGAGSGSGAWPRRACCGEGNKPRERTRARAALPHSRCAQGRFAAPGATPPVGTCVTRTWGTARAGLLRPGQRRPRSRRRLSGCSTGQRFLSIDAPCRLTRPLRRADGSTTATRATGAGPSGAPGGPPAGPARAGRRPRQRRSRRGAPAAASRG
jgi:hypothetical protein